MKKVSSVILLLLVLFVFSGCINGDDPDDSENVVRLVNMFDNIDSVGTEIAIGDEHFYVIGYDEYTVTLLAKYNLLVGNAVKCENYDVLKKFDSNNRKVGRKILNYGKYGLQSDISLGWDDNAEKCIGLVPFSSNFYWSARISYPAYVFDSMSNIYNYVKDYKEYLEDEYNISIIGSRLIKYEELNNLGCTITGWTCNSAPWWVSSTSYWTGSAADASHICVVRKNGSFYNAYPFHENTLGVRPVITISKILINK